MTLAMVRISNALCAPMVDSLHEFYSTPKALDHAQVQMFLAWFDECAVELAVEAAWLHA